MRNQKIQELQEWIDSFTKRKQEVERLLEEHAKGKKIDYIPPKPELTLVQLPGTISEAKAAYQRAKEKYDEVLIISSKENSTLAQRMQAFWKFKREKVSSTGVKLGTLPVTEVVIARTPDGLRPVLCAVRRKKLTGYYRVVNNF